MCTGRIREKQMSDLDGDSVAYPTSYSVCGSKLTAGSDTFRRHIKPCASIDHNALKFPIWVLRSRRSAPSIPTTCCVLPYQENHDPSLVHLTSPILSLRDPDCGCLRDTMLKCVLFRGSSYIACLSYACNTM